MRFVETPVFTREILRLLRDDDYRSLQFALLFRPDAGAIISGSGGLRKLRWSLPGRGKRGGMRVIYYWRKAEEVIYLLFVYPKNRQEDLTPQQLKILRNLVKENLE